MNATHTTLTIGDKITGITPTGKVLRTGTYLGFQNRASQTTPEAREYEALVRWDGDDHDSIVSFERLAPTADQTSPTRDHAVRAAALATRAYQTNPTTDLFAAMLTAIDHAHAEGATDTDIITATLNH